MAEPILNENTEKAQSESNLSITSNDIKIDLSKEFLVELRKNMYHGTHYEDVVDHIAKVLKMVDLIYVPGVDSHQLRMKVFPLSLADDAKEWWISDGDEKITTWEELVEKFFCRFYPESYDGEDEMLDEGENWGIDPLEFLSNINTSFKYHKKVDGRTQKEVILFYNGLDVPTRQILDSRGRSTETSDGLAAIQAQLNNLGIEIKKVNEKVYATQVGCEQCKGPHYTKDCPQNEEGKTLEEAYYTQFGGPFQGGGYRATALGYYQRNNANPLFQERRQSMEETLSKFVSESAKRHEENSNLIKEIRASMDAAIRNQGASIKTLEIQIGQMSKVLQERGFRSLPSSTETNPRDQVKSISTTIEADSNSIRRIGSTQYAISTELNKTLLYNPRQMTVPFPGRLEDHYYEKEGNYGPKFTKAYGASLINNTIPRKEKDPGSFTLPCFINDFCFDNTLVDLGASVSVIPLSTYLNLGLGELAHT
ncbi:hypothetical protein Tco_1242810, partial [Tanacetum coccineum]